MRHVLECDAGIHAGDFGLGDASQAVTLKEI
jgi:hypothetical protein